MTVRHMAILATAVAALSQPALAQQAVIAAATDPTPTANELDSYTPAFFANFQPESALDMVERIPGFTLRSGDNERGFGEANTNVLINGRRPSTKSQDIDDILGQIPAGTVIRLDVLDGDTLDIPGLSGQVVNVVAKAYDLSGRWRYAARFEEGTEPQLLEGEVTIAGKRGDLDFSLGLDSGQFIFTEDSTEVFLDGSGDLVEDRTEDVYLRYLSPSATLNLTWTPSAGRFADHVANLNASIEVENDNDGIREQFTAITPAGRTGDSFVDSGEHEVQLEIGGDYALPLSIGQTRGTLKLIGLTSLEDGKSDTIFVIAPEGENPVRTAFLEDYREGETIGRAEYGFKLGEAHDIQLSAEYAFNFLESETSFENNFVAPLLDRVRVEEDRFNARITDSWQISSDLSLQTSIGAEYSTLQVVNPRSDARNFLRPKGFAAISYKASEQYSIRARLDRSVGQLNFGTFVSTRNLADDLITSGNAEIKPSQSWELSAEFERTDEKLLSGRIRPFFELIEDPIDRILIGDNLEGPGNLDSATRYGIEANATLLFDTIGVPGLRLELEGAISDSRIDDPLTGESRQINFNEEYRYNLFARYDIPNTSFALTTRVRNDESSPFFRLDEIRVVDVREPFLSFGVIHKSFFGMQLSIRGTNLLDNTVIQQRDRFRTEDRRLGPLSLIERFERQRGRRLSITLSDTF